MLYYIISFAFILKNLLMLDWYQYNIYGFYFHYNILFHFSN